MRPEFGGSWNEVSAANEHARHCFHKGLLQDIFGRPPDNHVSWGPDKRDEDISFRFPWGEVSASTDFKGYSCGILIKYGS